MIHRSLAWLWVWLNNATDLNQTDIMDGPHDEISLRVLESVEKEKARRWKDFHDKYG